MRSFVAVILAMTLLVCAAAAEGPSFPGMIELITETPESPAGSDDALIRSALSALRSHMRNEYTPAKGFQTGIYTVDIRSTRLIRIKADLPEREAKYFSNIACVIEFLMYDDYYSLSGGGHRTGYHDISMMNNCCTVSRAGVVSAVSLSPIRTYVSRTYETDYSTFIEEVVDYGAQYNQVFSFIVP